MEKASRSRQASIAARAMLGFYRVALIVATLIAAVGTVIAIFVNQPQTYRASRVSSLNLVKCDPEPLVPMRCVTLGNDERFKFDDADDDTVLRWTRNRIEKDYSDEVGKIYWQSFRQTCLGVGAALVIGAAVYIGLAVLRLALTIFGWAAGRIDATG